VDAHSSDVFLTYNRSILGILSYYLTVKVIFLNEYFLNLQLEKVLVFNLEEYEIVQRETGCELVVFLISFISVIFQSPALSVFYHVRRIKKYTFFTI